MTVVGSIFSNRIQASLTFSAWGKQTIVQWKKGKVHTKIQDFGHVLQRRRNYYLERKIYFRVDITMKDPCRNITAKFLTTINRLSEANIFLFNLNNLKRTTDHSYRKKIKSSQNLLKIFCFIKKKYFDIFAVLIAKRFW